MQYRTNKQGEPISILGYGCMRFSKDKLGKTELDKTEREISAAIENGVNYFDTAYIYPGSEEALGEVLHRLQIRDKVQIATKLPHYLSKSIATMDKLFYEQLKRLKTDRVDYYLMHMLNDIGTWEKWRTLGVEDWISDKMAKGEIGHIGFSFHGHSDMFKKIVDSYDWDFCQIQYNYIDEVSQAGRIGLQHAASKGIPVIIMEPLRGGRLADPASPLARKMFEQNPRGWSPAEWGLRWLWDQPEVTCVLSGMNSIEMVEENCRAASESSANMLTDEDRLFIQAVKEAINGTSKVSCTGCGYCMPCPAGIDIPNTFRAYNVMFTESKRAGRMDYLRCTAFSRSTKSVSQCIDCGRCESRCPQQIKIREELKKASRELETIGYKVIKKGVDILKLW